MHPFFSRFDAVYKLVDPDGTRSRFVAVSGLNTLVGLAIFPVMMWTFSPYRHFYMVLLVASWVFATIFSFFTNKFLTFRTRGRYVAEFGKFSSFYVAVLLINLALLPICVEILHLPPVPLQFAFSLLGAVLSYFWHRRVTFRPRSITVDN